MEALGPARPAGPATWNRRAARTGRSWGAARRCTNRMSTPDYKKVRKHLSDACPVMKGVIARVGPCLLAPRGADDPFTLLVRCVIGQQISTKAAESIYEELGRLGVDVLIDDRDERAGVKFNDAELLGVPTIVVVGRGLDEPDRRESGRLAGLGFEA